MNQQQRKRLDATQGRVARPILCALAMMIILTVATRGGAGTNFGWFGPGIGGLIIGAGFGRLWTGRRVWVESNDGTALIRMWTHDHRARVTVAVIVGLGILWTVVMGTPLAGLGWLVCVLSALGAAAPFILPRFTGKGVQQARTALTDGQVVARYGQMNWSSIAENAGMTVKSEVSGLPRVPDFVEADTDEFDNPRLAVLMLDGLQTPDTYARNADRIASAWGVPHGSVSVNTVPEHPGIVLLTSKTKHFVRSGPVPWRPADADPSVVAYLSRLPLGQMADSSNEWLANLCEANAVIGGIPGAGKSVYLNDLLAQLARHPHIDTAMIDLKMGVEAAPWAARLSAIARDQTEAVELITWLLADAKSRYDRMREQGVRNAWKGGRDGTPFLGETEPVKVLIVDEAAELFAGGSRDARDRAEQATEDLRSLVSLGRAAGYVVILATQKPTVDTLPSAIRDLCRVRVAFACKTLSASAAILGPEANELSGRLAPTAIGADERGQAIAGNDRGEFERVQAALIDDDMIDAVVDQTAHMQRVWSWKSPVEPEPVEYQPAPAPAPEPVVLPDPEPEPEPVEYQPEQQAPASEKRPIRELDF